jgi:hypothetical protein
MTHNIVQGVLYFGLQLCDHKGDCDIHSVDEKPVAIATCAIRGFGVANM